jgi:hypothetical protein
MAMVPSGVTTSVVQRHPRVEAESPAAAGMSGRFGVAEPQIIPQAAGRRVGVSQQFAQRERLAVRRAQQVRRGKFVFREVAFEFKGPYVHCL